jgi:hypothetical protein
MSIKNISDHLPEKSDSDITDTDNNMNENLPEIEHLDERMASLPNEMSIGYTEHQP